MAEPEKIDLSKLVWSEKKIYSSKVVFKLCTLVCVSNLFTSSMPQLSSHTGLPPTITFPSLTFELRESFLFIIFHCWEGNVFSSYVVEVLGKEKFRYKF